MLEGKAHGTTKLTDEILKMGTHLIVIGAPKSGTTWLRDALAGTPGFWLGGRGETHYFDRSEAPSASEYSQLFNAAPKNLITVDITPDYLTCPAAMHLLTGLSDALQRDVKLVVLLREPAQRSFSHYQMLLDQGRIQGSFLENFVKGNPTYDASRYGYWLTKWRTKSVNVPLRAFLFDDLVKDPGRIILEIMRFCDIAKPNSETLYLPQRTNAGGLSRFRAWPRMRRWLGILLRKLEGERLVLKLKSTRVVQLLDSFNKRRLDFNSFDEKFARKCLAENVKSLDLLFPELRAKEKWRY